MALAHKQAAWIGAGVSLVLIGALMLLSLLRAPTVQAEYLLRPIAGDVSGVEPTSGFVLESTAPLSAQTVADLVQTQPPLSLATRPANGDGTHWELQPQQPLLEDTVYQFSIAKGPAATRDFGWAFQTKAPFRLNGSNPTDQATGVPTNQAIVLKFNRQGIQDIEDHLTLSPAVNGRFETRYEEVAFIPTNELSPKTVYTVTLSPGLLATGSDDRLAGEVKLRFETAETESRSSSSSFSFDLPFWDLRPAETPLVALYHYNLPTTQVRTRVVRFADRKDFLTAWGDTHSTDLGWTTYQRESPLSLDNRSPVFDGTLTIETVKETGESYLRLPEALAEGWYLLDAEVGSHHEQTWLQVTPVNVYLALSTTQTVVWLKDETGRGIANAAIGAGGASLGTTDASGLGLVATPSPLPDPRFLTIDAAGHAALVPLLSTYGYAPYLSKSDAWWDAVTVDKTLYQPSDSLRFWAIVQPRGGAGLGREPIEVQLTTTEFGSDRPTVFARTRVTSGDFATVVGELAWQAIPPGYYQLNFLRGTEVIASRGIDIESFRKPAYRLTVTPERLAVLAGEAVGLDIAAAFFDGTPVPNLKLRVQAENAEPSTAELTTDADGRAHVNLTGRWQGEVYSSSPFAYLTATVSSAVAEESDISHLTYLTLFPSRASFQDLSESSGKLLNFRARLRAVETDRAVGGLGADHYLGAPLPNQSVTLTFEEVIYDKRETGRRYDPISQTTEPVYEYFTRYVTVAQGAVTSDSDGLVSQTYPLQSNKTYRLTAQTTDPEGRTAQVVRYAYGTSTNRTPDQATEVSLGVLAKPTAGYAIGDPITVEMRNAAGEPVAGSPESFLFVRLTDGIDRATVSEVSRYDDTFTDTDPPTVALIGAWWDGTRFREANQSSFRGPLVSFSFNEETRRLTLDLEGLAERYRPGEDVNLTVRVTDREGRARDAEVLAGALDEAVFSINPEESDPLTDLYADRSPSLLSRVSHLPADASASEGGGCFRAGTPILRPDGSTTPIEALRPGDQIASRAADGSDELMTVTVVGVHPYQTFGGYRLINDALAVTANHKIWLNGGWALAGTARVGDTLTTASGPVPIRSIQRVVTNATVWNLDVTDPNSYYAAGYLVHNALVAGAEKGGGGIREHFEDVATWQTVTTGRDGTAEVGFTLPDSITSWRLALTAVTQDLFAGKAVVSLPVGLPFFVDATLAPTYLTDDRLALRLRSFGTGLTAAPITYTVTVDGLPSSTISQTGGSSVNLPLGQLAAGRHTVEISAEQNGQRDTIRRTVHVLPSYLTTPTVSYQEAAMGPVTAPAGTDRVTVTLLDASRAQLADELSDLRSWRGNRLDATIADWLAARELAKLTDSHENVAAPELAIYQRQEGLSLFPYSSPDVTLSATIAQLDTLPADGIDRGALENYFRSLLESADTDVSERARALAGLAGLGQPVLPALQFLQDHPDLTLVDQIFLGYGLESLGAREAARAYFTRMLDRKLVSRPPFLTVTGLRSDDEERVATALLAGLASRLDLPAAAGLGRAATTQEPKTTLSVLEQYLYLEAAVAGLPAAHGSITLTTPLETIEHDFATQSSLTLSLAVDPTAPLFTVTALDGPVGLVLDYATAEGGPLATTSDSLTITRRYLVGDRETREFVEGDLVRIEITPTVGRGALTGRYAVTDTLPSGLRVTDSRPADSDQPDSDRTDRFLAPATTVGQRLMFIPYDNRPFYYYARVVGTGRYRADPPIFYLEASPNERAVGETQTISIK